MHAGASRLPGRATRVGLISDTHGLLRPEAVAALRGCSHIIHGGDIGGASILEELERLAPVTCVRGNNDDEAWAAHLPDVAHLHVEDVFILIVHDLKQLSPAPFSENVRVVICGHSHKPSMDERGGVLFVNPGSAGRRRFKLPVTVGELEIEGASATARIVTLQIS